MSISRREFYLDLKHEELDAFFNEVRLAIAAETIPQHYAVDVLKDEVICCGIYPIGISIEIEGPDELQIRDLDKMAYSKVIEVCERQHIEYHEGRFLEIL